MRNERKEKKNAIKRGNLKERTKEFALRIIKLVETLPKRRTAEVVGRQFYVQALQLGLITVLLAEPDRLLTSSRRWAL
jgi:hypothetical protein